MHRHIHLPPPQHVALSLLESYMLAAKLIISMVFNVKCGCVFIYVFIFSKTVDVKVFYIFMTIQSTVQRLQDVNSLFLLWDHQQ